MRPIEIYDPFRSEFDLKVIAWQLSRMARWNGRTNQNFPPLSVAQHSVNVFNRVKNDRKADADVRAAILHDAHEIAIGDIPRPLKKMLMEQGSVIQAVQFAWDVEIARYFNLDEQACGHPAIRAADDIECEREREFLLGDDRPAADIPREFWPMPARVSFRLLLDCASRVIHPGLSLKAVTMLDDLENEYQRAGL